MDSQELLKEADKEVEEAWRLAEHSQMVVLVIDLLGDEAKRAIKAIWKSAYMKGQLSGLELARRRLRDSNG